MNRRGFFLSALVTSAAAALPFAVQAKPGLNREDQLLLGEMGRVLWAYPERNIKYRWELSSHPGYQRLCAAGLLRVGATHRTYRRNQISRYELTDSGLAESRRVFALPAIRREVIARDKAMQKHILARLEISKARRAAVA